MVSGIGVQDVGRRVDARVLGGGLFFVAMFSTVFLTMDVLVLTGALVRLDIEAQRFLDNIGINSSQEV